MREISVPREMKKMSDVSVGAEIGNDSCCIKRISHNSITREVTQGRTSVAGRRPKIVYFLFVQTTIYKKIEMVNER